MNFNTLQEDWGSVKPKELSLCANSSLLPVSLLSLGLKLLEESIGSSKEDGGRQEYFSFISLRKRDPGGGNHGQSFNRGRGAVTVLGIYDRNGAEPGPCLGGLLLSGQLGARLWSPTGIVLPSFSSLGSIG